MTGERTHIDWSADLGQEIEHALAVNPSPEFLARVRTRISSEPARLVWPLPWTLGSVGVAAAIALAVVMSYVEGQRVLAPPGSMSLQANRSSSGNERVAGRVSSPSVPATPAESRTPSPRGERPADTGPEILIAPDDALALQVLMAGIREGRVNPAVLDELQASATPVEPLEPIAIPLVAIEPIAQLAVSEGERQ